MGQKKSAEGEMGKEGKMVRKKDWEKNLSVKMFCFISFFHLFLSPIFFFFLSNSKFSVWTVQTEFVYLLIWRFGFFFSFFIINFFKFLWKIREKKRSKKEKKKKHFFYTDFTVYIIYLKMILYCWMSKMNGKNQLNDQTLLQTK